MKPRTTIPSRRTLVVMLFATTAVATGCETVVTEYHRRPSFYRMASDQELVDEYVDERGHRVVFVEDGPLPEEQRKIDEAAAARKEAKRLERARIRSEAIRAGKPIPPEGLEPEAPKMFQAEPWVGRQSGKDIQKGNMNVCRGLAPTAFSFPPFFIPTCHGLQSCPRFPAAMPVVSSSGIIQRCHTFRTSRNGTRFIPSSA